MQKARRIMPVQCMHSFETGLVIGVECANSRFFWVDPMQRIFLSGLLSLILIIAVDRDILYVGR
jgi:hypothetical protein